MATNEVTNMDPRVTVTSAVEDGDGDEKIGELVTNEYERQYFGFTPKSFSDGVHTAIGTYMSDAVQLVQQFMQSEFRMSDEESIAGAATIMSSISKVLDKACDKLESYIAEFIFKLPSRAILPEDRVQLEYDDPARDRDNLEHRITRLNEKIVNAKYVNASLRDEISQADEVKGHMDNQLEYFQSIQRIMNDGLNTSLKESLMFTNDQLEKLKKTIGNIEMKSPTTPKRKRSEQTMVVKRINLGQSE